MREKTRATLRLPGTNRNRIWNMKFKNYTTYSEIAKAFEFEKNNSGYTITNYKGKSDSIAIPSKINGIPVTTIDNWAFYGNQIQALEIPNSVTTIGYAAFWGNQIKSVNIPNNVTSLHKKAFDEKTIINYKK